MSGPETLVGDARSGRQSGPEAARREPSEGVMEAWRSLLLAHAAAVELLGREMEEESQLPLTWYEVLLHLNAGPDRRLRMSELADRVLLSRSGLTRLVDRLAKQGLVERESCDTDKRGSFAVLTALGRQRLREAAPGHLRGIEAHFGRHVSPAEAGVIARCLSKVASEARTSLA